MVIYLTSLCNILGPPWHQPDHTRSEIRPVNRHTALKFPPRKYRDVQVPNSK